MSAREVLATTRGAIEDAATGLTAKVEALKAADPALAAVRSDFHHVRWSLADRPQPTTKPNVAARVRRAQLTQKLAPAPSRDGRWTVDVAFETFGGDTDQIEDEVTTVATALLQVLDGLREYSDATGGTILDVEDPISVEFGEFGGPVTSYGFLCSFTVLERSTV